MANKKQEFVAHLTPRDVDFAQWYTDVILKTELVDYAPVRGCMAIRPYGYALWENIQRELDTRFKATGHSNVSMPMFIPESLLKKEAEHVEGFAPEVAYVTHGGSEQLTERLVVRPTSETLFSAMYSKWVQSYRDLPMLYNQWCSVVRWEKTTRPFLRTAEFLWQEGHTCHATAEDSKAETEKMLAVYKDMSKNALAMPVIAGRKSDKEKFAGAEATYSIEAMMQDGKALQSGTSHNFGDRFAKAFDITYLSKEGKLEYCHQTSWGASTRLIGGIIMVHGDERGLVMPPRVAPIQAVILPIAAHKEGVMEGANNIYDSLKSAGIRVNLDDREGYSAGWKFNEWEMKGVPIRIEVGPRDLEQGVVTICRRDNFEKSTLPIDGLADAIAALLDTIHDSMFKKASDFMQSHIKDVQNMDELKVAVQDGFARAMWCGDRACEDAIKEQTGAPTRNMPEGEKPLGDKCVCCGKPANKVIYFAKQY